MADTKISALSAVTSPASTDVIPVVNSGVTKKVTLANAVIASGILATSISDSDTTHAPDGNSVFDALALKANASAVSNVDNTSDANKPVSTATQTALDGKLSSIAPLVIEGANTVAQRNSTNAQSLFVYRTYVDASNWKRGGLDYIDSGDGVGVALHVGQLSSGSGADGSNVVIGTYNNGLGSSTGYTYFTQNNSLKWYFGASGIEAQTDNSYDLGASGANRFRNLYLGTGLAVEATITAGGTTGAQTINKAAGTVNMAAGQSALVVTNSLCTASSLVFAVIRTNDATSTIKNVVAVSGSFTITLTATATAETSIGFFIVQPD